MDKRLAITALAIALTGVVVQSLSYFHMFPDAPFYQIVTAISMIISPWFPPVLLYISFSNNREAGKSGRLESGLAVFIIASVYALFLSPLMPWFSSGKYVYIGMIGFVFPFVISLVLLSMLGSMNHRKPAKKGQGI